MGVIVYLPLCGLQRHGQGLCTVAMRAQGVGEERLGVDVAQAIGIDDAGDDAEGVRARFGSGVLRVS